jgi:hypothetical protein
MLPDDRRVNHQNLPANAFSLKEVNDYLAPRNNKPQNPVMNELLGHKDLHCFMVKNGAAIVEQILDPWPCTIFPRDPNYVKYQSVWG